MAVNLLEKEYDYPLPSAVLRLVEEFKEDEEKTACLEKILNQCTYDDLRLLRDYEKLSHIIEEFLFLTKEPDKLLNKLVNQTRNDTF